IICTAGFPSVAIASSSFTARCASIWYGFFIATLLFSPQKKIALSLSGSELESRYFLRSTGHSPDPLCEPVWFLPCWPDSPSLTPPNACPLRPNGREAHISGAIAGPCRKYLDFWIVYTAWWIVSVCAVIPLERAIRTPRSPPEPWRALPQSCDNYAAPWNRSRWRHFQIARVFPHQCVVPLCRRSRTGTRFPGGCGTGCPSSQWIRIRPGKRSVHAAERGNRGSRNSRRPCRRRANPESAYDRFCGRSPEPA